MKSGLVNRGFINQMADVNADLSRFMLENANEAVYVYDEDCQIVYVNELAIKDSGYSKAELLEMKIMDLDPVFSHSRNYLSGPNTNTKPVICIR